MICEALELDPLGLSACLAALDLAEVPAALDCPRGPDPVLDSQKLAVALRVTSDTGMKRLVNLKR